jgi:hypothetical protein
MNAKEKAKELVEKMMLYSYEKIENEKNTKYIVDNKIKKEYAIQCALIAVEELIKISYWGGEIDNEIEINSKEYFMKIKEEIINL